MENMRNKGKLIVIDGGDGTGKATQTELLIKRLQIMGMQVETMSFPRYEEPGSLLVRRYLAGEFGTAKEVGPKVASAFFAVDRWAASGQLRAWLDAGIHVVLNRYVAANMGHQGGKIDDPEKRAELFRWLHDLEHVQFGIPEPDLNIILHVDMERTLGLIDGRGAAKDIHEQDPDHLAAAERVYLEIAGLFPDKFRLVECMRDGELLSRADIHDLIWQIAYPVLTTHLQPA